MRPEKKASQGANPARLYQGRKDRADQSLVQYSLPAKNLKAFDVDEHIRAARRAMGDAVIMLFGWPACIQHSYSIGQDGKLITREEWRAGA